MFYKILKLLYNLVEGSREPIYIFSDGSGKFKTSSVVIIDRGLVRYLRYTNASENSALCELAGLQMSLLISKMYVNLGRKVHIRLDNKGVCDAYNRAKQGFPSGAPIHRKLLDFLEEDMYDTDLSLIRVNWCRGHDGLFGNMMADHLCRYETLDNHKGFDYFNSMTDYAWEKTK